MNKKVSLRKRLGLLLQVSLVPAVIMTIIMLVMVNRVSNEYDKIVTKITTTNEYNLAFKENLDYAMYIIVVNAERANELIKDDKPEKMIEEARATFYNLLIEENSEIGKNELRGIIKSFDTLEKRVEEIENNAIIAGSYEKNMESLELDIRVLTELIQEQIQKYIANETSNLDELRIEIRKNVMSFIRCTIIILAIILMGALFISEKILNSIVEPVKNLCQVSKKAGAGDFEIRTEEYDLEEIQILSVSFNRMVEQLGKLVEDIKVEQKNLQMTELKLLQEQINPHFLYNTLDNIIWLAEDEQMEDVVKMVSSLSDFFRTGLSKGRDFVTIQEEETHIRSYLEIQKFRYRDIMEYEICLDEDIKNCQILKLTLQPLVENALYHGVKNKRGMSKITVTGSRSEKNLIIKVIDTGIGMKSERLEYVRKLMTGEFKSDSKQGGFGLHNVYERLRLNYGNEYGITMESGYGEGTTQTLTIPIQEV